MRPSNSQQAATKTRLGCTLHTVCVCSVGIHIIISTTVDLHDVLHAIPQMDRATRCIGWNLISCCTTEGTSCARDPQRIEVMELEHYAGRTCNKLRASGHDALTIIHDGQCGHSKRQRVLLTLSTKLVHSTTHLWLAVAKFSKSKVPEGSSLIFGDTRISL